MSTLQESEQEGDQESDRKKVKRQLLDSDSSSIGVVSNPDARAGLFRRPQFEGLTRTAIPINSVPEPQYTDAPSVTNVSDHAPSIMGRAPTEKVNYPKSLQEGDQESEVVVPGRVRNQEAEVYGQETDDQEDRDDNSPDQDVSEDVRKARERKSLVHERSD